MSEKKVVEGIEKLINDFNGTCTEENSFSKQVAQIIYNNRKELGLFTKNDIRLMLGEK